MDSIPSRVNDLEKTSHTHEHRITQLEKLPPRVGDLESSVRSMSVSMHHIEANNQRIKSVVDEIKDYQSVQSGEIVGFSKAAKAFGFIITLLTLGNLIASWISH